MSVNHGLKDALNKERGRQVSLLLDIGQKVEGELLKVTSGGSISGYIAVVKERTGYVLGEPMDRTIVVDLEHVIAASWPVEEEGA